MDTNDNNLTKTKSKGKTIHRRTADWYSSSSSPSSSSSSSSRSKRHHSSQPKTVLSKLRKRSSSEFRSRSSSNVRTSRSHSNTSSGPSLRSNSPLEGELKMPTVISKKLNYSEKIAKKMKKTFQLYDKVVPFKTSLHVCNLFYLYLFKKYKMDCVISNLQDGVELLLNLKNTNAIKTRTHDYLIKQTSEKIISCILNGSKIIIIPLTFEIFIDGQPMGSHANLLIYRHNTSQLEHFEPHGPTYVGIGEDFVSDQINAFLKGFVKNLNSLIKEENKLEGKHEKIQPIKLINAHFVCSDLQGLQALEAESETPLLIIEPDGYCAAWSMFFTELCLKNPERSSRDIYDAIMERTDLYDDKNTYLRNVIRGYTFFINNKIAKHFSHVFDEDGFLENMESVVEQFDFDNPDPIEAAKLHSYSDKLLEIMEVETGKKTNKTIAYPEVRSRYNEFTQGIREETSSSSYKSDHHISPPRKTKKSTFLHRSSSPRSEPLPNSDKGVGQRKTRNRRKTK